jgi:hypothetical protein
MSPFRLIALSPLYLRASVVKNPAPKPDSPTCWGQPEQFQDSVSLPPALKNPFPPSCLCALAVRTPPPSRTPQLIGARSEQVQDSVSLPPALKNPFPALCPRASVVKTSSLPNPRPQNCTPVQYENCPTGHCAAKPFVLKSSGQLDEKNIGTFPTLERTENDDAD